ncbi:hypothetical protein K8I85_11200 [bacterium]|nr:hypothetical protein [bacterium]
MRTVACLFLAAVFALPASAARAEQHAFNVALFSPAQIFPPTDDVRGLRLNLLYGRNVNVSGVELGAVAGYVTGDFRGLQWQPVNLVDGDFTGWQTGWLFSQTRGDFLGLQSSAVNFAGGHTEGLQLGVVNVTDSMSGLQLGLVNIAERTDGLQIGLVNVIKSKESLPVLPIVNWTF